MSDCVICGFSNPYSVLLPCDHSIMCPKCFLTLDNCHHQHLCPLCQKEFSSPPIIIDSNSQVKYSADLTKRLSFSTEFQIYYQNNKVIELLESYLRFHCPECKTQFVSKKKFTDHLLTHQLKICNICFKSNRFLNCELVTYNKNNFFYHKK